MFKSNGATAFVLAAAVLVTGCASNVPQAQYSMRPDEAHVFKSGDDAVVNVSASGSEVSMLESDKTRIAEKLQMRIHNAAPASDSAVVPGQYRVEVKMTRYDKGNAFARAIIAGLGQIHIDADVAVYDSATNAQVNGFKITKTFAWGGVYGATKNITDIEDPFVDAIYAGLRGIEDGDEEANDQKVATK